jgi:uncharacterized membrane protein
MRIKALNKFLIIPLAAIVLVPALLLGLTGLRSMLAMILLLFLPVFVIINNLDLEGDEKVFFSFFISLAMFSLVVWYVNRIIYSLRISVIVAFFLLSFAGLAMGFYNKKKRKPKHG